MDKSKAIERKPFTDIEITNELAVRIIRNLPDHLMEQIGIIMPWESKNPDRAKMANLIRECHRSHADWLEYYLLNNVNKLPELKFTRKIHYKIFAERSMSYLRLAQEVYPKSEIAQQYKLIPLAWVICIEIQKTEEKLVNTFLDPIDDPLRKSEGYNLARNHYGSLESLAANFSATRVTTTDTGVSMSPFEFLEFEAISIAQREIEFRNNFYRAYLQEQKRFYRKMRDSQLQLVQRDNDGRVKILSTTGRPKNNSEKTLKGFSRPEKP